MSTGDAPLVQLVVGGSAEPWQALGLPVVSAGGAAALLTSNCPVIWPGGDLPPGSVMLAVDPATDSVCDGLALATPDPSIRPDSSHSLSVDHLVINTDDLERTCGEIERVTGYPLKRIRDAGAFRQGFHRLGPGGLIIEVVDRPGTTAPECWGFVITVDDLDALVESSDGLIGAPRDAVQPGRRIATVSTEASLGVAVAFMSR